MRHIALILFVVFMFGIRLVTINTYSAPYPVDDYKVSIYEIMTDTSSTGNTNIFYMNRGEDVFNEVIGFVLKHEGDRFVDDRSINEVSRRGITLGAYIQYYGRGNNNSIRNITEEQATEIYKHLFWKAHSMDSIANIGFPKTAMTLMDSGVNIGPYRANKYLQLVLGVQLTGSIDERTLSTLRETELTDEQIASRLLQRRSNFYARLVARDSVYQKYHNGWNNRVNDMRELVEAI